MNGQHSFGEIRVSGGTSKALPHLNGSSVSEAVDRSLDLDSQPAEEGIHANQTVSHLYESGFNHGNFSDMSVHIGSAVYRLHALILSRSPFLVHLMSTSPFKDMIYVPMEQYPDITPEAMFMALGFLYSYQASKTLSQANARAVLASACLLGGMDDLANRAYHICKESIRVETIEDWLTWVDAHPSPFASHSPTASAASTPRSPSPQSTPEMPVSTIYGHYAQYLRDDVLEFLIVSLPTILFTDNENKPEIGGDAQEALLRIFSRVSFDIFKTAMESPRFLIGSDHDRFRFAKAAITKRRQFAGRGADEAVVLAVGDGKGNIHVTRKVRRKALWKVSK